MDRGKGCRNHHWQSSEEVRVGQHCLQIGLPGKIISEHGTTAVHSWRRSACNTPLREIDLTKNNEALGMNLDLIEERREQAAIQEAKRKKRWKSNYYSRMVAAKFQVGDWSTAA
ncbi:hypothetical protein Tco_0936325 [Tanacetum coccineum]